MLNRENADGAAMSDTVLKVIAKFGERAFEKVVDAAVQAICESMVQDASNNPNAPGPYRRFKAWLAGPSPIQQQMRDALGQTFALYLQSEHGQVAQMLLDADFFKLPDVGAELQKALYPGQKVNIDKLAESWQQIWRPEYGNNIDKHRATEALNFIVDELRRAIRMQPLLQAFVTNTLTEEMLEVAQRQLDAQLEQRDLQRQQLVEQKRGNQLLEKLAIGSSSKDQQAIEETEAPPTGGSSAIMARFADDIPNRGETFIGRDDIMQRIEVRFIMQRIEVRFTAKRKRSHLLLQGFSGMGKTTIAAQYAAQWIERQQGSVLWVEANAAPSDVLLESVAGAFNQDARQSVAKEVTPTGKGNVIRQHLRQVSLLVIDNAWDGNALFDLLNATPDELPVLITARQIYSIKTGDIIPVEELAADSALAILSYHAGKTLAPEAEARAICKTLGYLPFALEIAGKLLRDQSLAELSKSLDRAHELEMPLGFTQKGRESVVALLRTSIESLPEDTRMVLITCGAFFAPRITAEMLALYSPNIDTGAARTNLVFHGLLKRLDATPEAVASYRLHDLTFSYLQTLNDDTSHQRALEACLAYLERYSEPSLTNFAALRPELDGLLAAAAWASRNGQEQAVEDFAWGLYTGPNGEDRFLVRQGRYAQAIQLLTQATATSERAGNKDTQGAHLCNLGIAYYRIGQAGRAIRYYEQSLEISLSNRWRSAARSATGAARELLSATWGTPTPN